MFVVRMKTFAVLSMTTSFVVSRGSIGFLSLDVTCVCVSDWAQLLLSFSRQGMTVRQMKLKAVEVAVNMKINMQTR